MAALSPPVDIGTLIRTNRKGQPCVGKNINVSRVVELSREPLTPEQIAEDVMGLEVLSVADVHAALAYYHLNRALIEAEIAEQQLAYAELERDHRVLTPQGLRNRQPPKNARD